MSASVRTLEGPRRVGPCWEIRYKADGHPWDEESNPHYRSLAAAVCECRSLNTEPGLWDPEDAPDPLFVRLAPAGWEARCARCGVNQVSDVHWGDEDQCRDAFEDADCHVLETPTGERLLCEACVTWTDDGETVERPPVTVAS